MIDEKERKRSVYPAKYSPEMLKQRHQYHGLAITAKECEMRFSYKRAWTDDRGISRLEMDDTVQPVVTRLQISERKEDNSRDRRTRSVLLKYKRRFVDTAINLFLI